MRYVRRHALFATILLGLAGVGLFGVRVLATERWLFLFLPYNLALAWAPVGFALLANGIARTRLSVLALPLLALWLVFLPNSAYLVTDLVHLRDRPEIPHVFDSTLCATFAAAGVLAGVSSLSLAEETLRSWVGRASVALLVPIALLNGLGVYIGRYNRWNSWDLARDPGGILTEVWTPLWALSPHIWGITLTYAGVLLVSWLALVSVRPPASAAHTRHAHPGPVATAH